MASCPNLDELRHVNRWNKGALYKKQVYVKQSRGHGGLVHTKLWESIKINNRHTLRLEKAVAESILKKKGPHGRRDGTRGQPASGIRHMIRRELMLLFHIETEKLVEILNLNTEYKSGKKQDITMVMPNLSIAINELYSELIEADDRLANHPVFKRMWAPCACRLVELVWIYKYGK